MTDLTQLLDDIEGEINNCITPEKAYKLHKEYLVKQAEREANNIINEAIESIHGIYWECCSCDCKKHLEYMELIEKILVEKGYIVKKSGKMTLFGNEIKLTLDINEECEDA